MSVKKIKGGLSVTASIISACRLTAAVLQCTNSYPVMFISRLLRNDAITAYIRLVQPELGIELNGVLDAITVDARSMERE